MSTSGSGQNNYINNYDWNSQTVSSGYRYCANEYGLYCFQPYPDHGGYLGPMVEMYSIYKGPIYHLQTFSDNRFMFQNEEGNVVVLDRSPDQYYVVNYEMNEFKELQQTDNQVYFIEDYDYLYKLDLETYMIELVISELSEDTFTISDEGIYYIVENSYGSNVLMYRAFGSARSDELFTFTQDVQRIYYYNGVVYYINYDGIGRYIVDSGSDVFLYLDFSYSDTYFTENYFVFNTSFNEDIYVFDLIYEDFIYLYPEGDFMVDDGNVYIYDYGSYNRTNYNVDMISLNTMTLYTDIITTGDIRDVLYVEGDWIYYTKRTNNEVYRFNIYTEIEEHIGNFIGDIICIDDSDVLYMEQGYTGLNRRSLVQAEWFELSSGEHQSDSVINNDAIGSEISTENLSSIHFDLQVSSTLKENINGEERIYTPLNMFDNDYTTTWAEGSSTNGTDEWILFTSESPFTLESIQLTNGYTKTEDLYFRNNRAIVVKVTFDNGPNMVFELNDGILEMQNLTIDMTNVYSFRIDIMDISPGTAYNDLCITELRINNQIPNLFVSESNIVD